MVEDDAAISANLTRFLRFEGFDVLAAGNGREGLRTALDEHPDLVLCDLRMPEMTGEELLVRLHADAAGRDVPVVFLTASADREEREATLALGASEYLVKPVDLQELLAAVNRHVRKPS